MQRILMIVLAATILSACTAKVKAPEAEVKVPGVEIEVGGNGGKFCPPGQAKKGNC